MVILTSMFVGTPLYGHKVNADGSAGELKIVRAGIFGDETVNKYKPGHEVYTGRRVCWLDPADGAEQFEGMAPL